MPVGTISVSKFAAYGPFICFWIELMSCSFRCDMRTTHTSYVSNTRISSGSLYELCHVCIQIRSLWAAGVQLVAKHFTSVSPHPITYDEMPSELITAPLSANGPSIMISTSLVTSVQRGQSLERCTVDAIIAEIERERRGDYIDQPLMRVGSYGYLCDSFVNCLIGFAVPWILNVIDSLLVRCVYGRLYRLIICTILWSSYGIVHSR